MAATRRKPQRKSGARKKRPARRNSGSTWAWGAALVAIVTGIATYDNFADVRSFTGTLIGSGEQNVAASNTASTNHQVPTVAPERSRSRQNLTPPETVPSRDFEAKRKSKPQNHEEIRTAAISPPVPLGRPAATERSQALPAVMVPPEPVGGQGERNARTTTPVAVKPDLSVVQNGSYRAKFYLCGTAKQDDCVVAADTFILKGQKIRIAGIEVPDIKKPRCEAERIKASDAKLRVRAFLDSGPFEVVSVNAGDADSSGQKIRGVIRNGVSLSDVLVRDGLARRPGTTGGWC